MTNGEWTPDQDAGFNAPPVEMIDSLEPTSSKWPTVIGIFGIVLAALGLLCYGCQSLSQMLQPMLQGMAPEGQKPPAMPSGLFVIAIVQYCVSWVLSLWLLIAAIGLVRRRAWSRGHLIAWSFAKIALVAIATLLSLLVIDDTVKYINDSMTVQSPGATPMFTMTKGIYLILVVVSLVWFLIWPCFLILWLGREHVKEEVEAWAAESAAAI